MRWIVENFQIRRIAPHDQPLHELQTLPNRNENPYSRTKQFALAKIFCGNRFYHSVNIGNMDSL
jgi:hypothetical protein